MASASYSFAANVALIPLRAVPVLVILFGIWLWFTDFYMKIDSILIALTYACVEVTWYSITRKARNGAVFIVPLHKKGRKGFTSVEQALGNVFYSPISYHGYLGVFSYVASLFPFAHLIVNLISVILFPFNIWLLEIVLAELFYFLYGFNPAWNYTGAPGSRLGGAINISHWKLWILMGCFACIGNATIGCVSILLGVALIQTTKRYALGNRNN